MIYPAEIPIVPKETIISPSNKTTIPVNEPPPAKPRGILKRNPQVITPQAAGCSAFRENWIKETALFPRNVVEKTIARLERKPAISGADGKKGALSARRLLLIDPPRRTDATG
jgi:hypothetical protein